LTLLHHSGFNQMIDLLPMVVVDATTVRMVDSTTPRAGESTIQAPADHLDDLCLDALELLGRNG
jgi:hypothetical protein